MFGIFILFTLIVNAQNIQNICQNKQIHTLGFDDVTIYPDSYIALPRPYLNFVFKRVNTVSVGYSDDNVAVANLTAAPAAYQNAENSPPNVILTTGESFSLKKVDNSIFNIVKLYITSIYINNMGILIKCYKNGVYFSNVTLNIQTTYPTEINLNWKNIDEVIIGCSNPEYATCAHATHDDITVCY